MSESKIREQIVEVGRSLFNRGLTAGSSGNISVQVADGWIMTPTNVSLGNLDPGGLSKIDFAGTLISGSSPTKEHFIHRAVYSNRKETKAIVHLHSTHSVAVSMLPGIDPMDVLPPLTAYYIMRVGHLPLIPYFRPGDAKLSDAVGIAMRESKSVLLANHGPVVTGTSLEEAVNASEELEETAKLFLLTRGLNPKALTKEQIKELVDEFKLEY